MKTEFVSVPYIITPQLICGFCGLTGDMQHIHHPAMAEESSLGKQISSGFLTMALLSDIRNLWKLVREQRELFPQKKPQILQSDIRSRFVRPVYAYDTIQYHWTLLNTSKISKLHQHWSIVVKNQRDEIVCKIIWGLVVSEDAK